MNTYITMPQITREMGVDCAHNPKKMGIAEASPNFCTGSVTQVTEVTHFLKIQYLEM